MLKDLNLRGRLRDQCLAGQGGNRPIHYLMLKSAGVKSIHLINAVLALSLFGIVTIDLSLFDGLSLDTRRAIGLIAFAANVVIGIYGAVTSHRIAWSAYLILSVAGLVLIGAATPIVALWLALMLL